MDAACAEQIGFLLPGLTHGLGNALFAIQGRLQLLDPGATERLAADRSALLEAAAKARRALDVLTALQGEVPARTVAAGDGVQQLADLLRVPLRDRGLGLRLVVDAGAASERVSARALFAAGVEVARQVARAWPAGFAGDLVLRLSLASSGVALCAAPRGASGQLPFPVDATAVSARTRAALTGLGVVVRELAGETQVILGPGAAASGDASASGDGLSS